MQNHLIYSWIATIFQKRGSTWNVNVFYLKQQIAFCFTCADKNVRPGRPMSGSMRWQWDRRRSGASHQLGATHSSQQMKQHPPDHFESLKTPFDSSLQIKFESIKFHWFPHKNRTNTKEFRAADGHLLRGWRHGGHPSKVRSCSSLRRRCGFLSFLQPKKKKIIWNNALLPDTCVIKPSTRAPHFNVPDTFVPDTGANLFGADLQPINEWGVGSLPTVGKGRGQVCPG